jgi:hypothetical protein
VLDQHPTGLPIAEHDVENPAGRIPAAISARRTVVCGVVSLGFSTTVLPAARAGPIFHTAMFSG